MMLYRHVVPLAPIGLPASAYWEAGFQFKRNFRRGSESVGWRYVSNIVANPKTFDIVGIFRANVLKTILAFMVNVEINTTPLATYFRASVFNVKVLIDSNVAPVWNCDWSSSLCKNNLWFYLLKGDDEQIEGEGLSIFIRSKSQACVWLLNVFFLWVSTEFIASDQDLHRLLWYFVWR